jgi:hypothetical protein
MNKCILQFWEESERGWGVRPDGCSLHLNESECEKYVNNVYKDRNDDVPHEYDRIVGHPIYCFVSDNLYTKLVKNGYLRLMENEKNNLVKMEEIIFKSI